MQPSIYKHLEDLDFYNQKLTVLLTNCTNAGYPAQGRIPLAAAPVRQDILHQIKKHAVDIHEAICEGYRCQCEIPHLANLGLRNLAPTKLSAVEEAFELLFPIDDPQDNPAARMSAVSIPGVNMASPKSTSDHSVGSMESTESYILE